MKPKRQIKFLTLRLSEENHAFLKQLSIDTSTPINSIINTLIYEKKSKIKSK